MNVLTHKQARILEYLKDQIQAGIIPSFREIMRHFKFKGPRAVTDHLKALEKKGYIKRGRGMARSIEVLGLRLLDSIELPILGRIAAGSPILAEENIEGSVAIDRSWVQDKNSFVLKVQGDSMIEAGIHDGDYAIIKQDYTARDKDIVVALIEDEATLKRFYLKDNKIILKPENSAMHPIIIERNNAHIRIIGKLIGVYRKLL